MAAARASEEAGAAEALRLEMASAAEAESALTTALEAANRELSGARRR